MVTNVLRIFKNNFFGCFSVLHNASSLRKYVLPRTFVLSFTGKIFNNSIFTEGFRNEVSSHQTFRNQHLSLPPHQKREGEKKEERWSSFNNAGEQSGSWLIPSFASTWFLIYLGWVTQPCSSFFTTIFIFFSWSFNGTINICYADICISRDLNKAKATYTNPLLTSFNTVS